MDSNHFDAGPVPVDAEPSVAPSTAKILIAGGFGVGKTTLVGAISEIKPLRTEEPLSDRGIGIDENEDVQAKTTTTVAMDFGRISFRNQLVLYLFGTPGQERFWFMWDDLAVGAIGAVVLADTRRIGDCFASIDYFERAGVPFIVAVNCFDGAPRFEPADIRIALTLSPEIPIVLCDARAAASVKMVLVSLVRHVMTRPRLDTVSRLFDVTARSGGAADEEPTSSSAGAETPQSLAISSPAASIFRAPAAATPQAPPRDPDCVVAVAGKGPPLRNSCRYSDSNARVAGAIAQQRSRSCRYASPAVSG